MSPDPNFESWFIRLETRFDGQFDKLAGRFDKLDEKLDGTVTGQAQHEERIKSLEAKQTSRGALWAAVGIAALAWVPDILSAFAK